MRPILLVDDDSHVRTCVRDVLADAGYEVVEATDGADAIRRISRNLRPSLVLLDLMMPGLNGMGFLERVQKTATLRAIPVVLLSGLPKRPYNGAVEFISKPFEIRTLLDAVWRHTGIPPDGSGAPERSDPYRIQIATSARAALALLEPSEWEILKAKLEEIAELAARIAPPTRELLELGGLKPPLLRIDVGSHMVLYEADRSRRTLTVLHLVKFLGRRSQQENPGPSARSA